MRERLTSRGQDDETTINRRMHDAVSEMSHYHEFDYVVVNDDFDEALQDLKTIVTSQRLHIRHQQHHLESLINELLA